MPANTSLSFERAHEAIFKHAAHVGPRSVYAKHKAHPQDRTEIALRVYSLTRPLSATYAHAGAFFYFFLRKREMHVNGSFPQASSDHVPFLI